MSPDDLDATDYGYLMDLDVTAPTARADRLAKALRTIVSVLGPEICTCENSCHGLQEEAGVALRLAKEALDDDAR